VRHLVEESQPYRFSREEFEQMLRAGWFDGQPAELVEGVVQSGSGAAASGRHHWTRDEYLQMREWGWFDHCKAHLVGGEVIEMASQYDPHVAGVTLTADALRKAFGQGYWVRTQASLDLSPHGIPDPDVVVIAGSPRGARPRHIPTSALLVVEVSETTLREDRTTMASLYAAGGVADYWILNLVQRQLEVYRNPVPDGTLAFGWGYADRSIFDPAESVSPLVLAHFRIAVADLLP
jgi:Uma2 family endonuclease